MTNREPTYKPPQAVEEHQLELGQVLSVPVPATTAPDLPVFDGAVTVAELVIGEKITDSRGKTLHSPQHLALLKLEDPDYARGHGFGHLYNETEDKIGDTSEFVLAALNEHKSSDITAMAFVPKSDQLGKRMGRLVGRQGELDWVFYRAKPEGQTKPTPFSPDNESIALQHLRIKPSRDDSRVAIFGATDEATLVRAVGAETPRHQTAGTEQEQGPLPKQKTSRNLAKLLRRNRA